jgi:hypothetical protein
MKKAYGEGLKKIVNGYATTVYLIVVAWLMCFLTASILFGLYGLISAAASSLGGGDVSLTGWQDLQPEEYGQYNASAKTFSVLFANYAGEPVKIDSSEAVDIQSGTDCNVSSPVINQILNTSESFAFNATCPGAGTQSGEQYGILVQIYYATVNNPLAPLLENGYFSGNATL